jgi:hypothetical protein
MEIVPPADQQRRAPRVEPLPLRVRLQGTWDGILVDIGELGAPVQLPVAQTIHSSITLEIEREHDAAARRARRAGLRSTDYGLRTTDYGLRLTGAAAVAAEDRRSQTADCHRELS